MRRKVAYDPARDYYVVLGVNANASTEEIRHAYRRRAREVHPDLHPDRHEWATEQFQLVLEAYDVLRHAGLRRDYDQLRWPHAPQKPRPRSPLWDETASDTTYDPSRTWWEHATAQSNRQAAYFRQERSPSPEVSGWPARYGLGGLTSTWTTITGLWRTPYGGLLAFLCVLLALDLGAVVYIAIAPAESRTALEEVEGWFAAEGTPTPTATAPPTATPERLFRACPDAGAQILTPVSFDTVGDTFSVFGTVKDPQLWNYRIEVGYLGRAYNPQSAPAAWEVMRPPPPNQSVPEMPVEDDLLTEAVSLSNRAPGYYVLRLRVTLRDGSALTPCDVILRH